MSQTTLCLDIGSGTQDVLLYSPDMEVENCPKFVIPSPALQVGKRIATFTTHKENIWLHGRNMGGGVTRFIRAHQKAGLKVASSESAAYTIADDLTRISGSGIQLSETCPDGFTPVLLTDFDEQWWRNFLEAAELPWPNSITACAQDHGFHPGESNRMGRFKLWQSLLTDMGGHPEALVYDTPPPMLTRLVDLQEDINGGPVADTGAAAVLGALFVDEIEKHSQDTGITLVNIGNSHLIAFLLYDGRIHGVYEQHTGCVDGAKLWADLENFRCGCLSFDQVFEEKGHGCLTLDLPPEAGNFRPTYVLGPRRSMLSGYDVSFPAPGGDMMLAGCFGLIKGLAMR
ncbi:DUF1786 domain-containing protein [Pseudodesulfovibrio piezophilus]|uniref:Uncharacterized protein n=1 Tax=Pseudodesulfovibrio piezophilus (strain DSM 21447 / JCM 15486 / C1TLV30) TaxID=1322246 RepID=M1WMN7_PSEP2|nr:DUF1786 domain-containing protein [Pseudodesulfovibrio piezophilus]CCH49840.1 conserved protein of unknown function [Pseudodesulfovibrio piezophilus C1TLV30]